MFGLLIAFSIKHFIADFPLQNEYMLGKFKRVGWVKPLIAHAGLQALFTFLISLVYGFTSLPMKLIFGVALLDFVIHFIVDRLKAHPDLGGRWKYLLPVFIPGSTPPKVIFVKGVLNFTVHEDNIKDIQLDLVNAPTKEMKRSNKMFWNALGMDQLCHALTDILIIYILTSFTN